MTDQPEALKMANRLDDESSIQGIFGTRVAVRLCADVAHLLREQHAEIERLRADAERYRWMKREVRRIPPAWELMGWDAAIDKAMAEERKP